MDKVELRGINPLDAIVDFIRQKYDLLIGEPTADRILTDFKMAKKVHPHQDVTRKIPGRCLVSGLPKFTEVSSVEILGLNNSEKTKPYVNWSAEPGGATIGELLYSIAAHEFNALYIGILQQNPPDEIDTLFERDIEKLDMFLANQTLAQHWERLEAVRNQLIETYREMSLEDFQRLRPSPKYRYAEWVLHDLCQFEAERRSDITALYATAKKALGEI